MSHFRFSSSSDRLLHALAAVTLAVSAGCTTGQIGGEVDRKGDNGEAAGNSCKETGRADLELDEVTSLGFSAEEVMNAISGTHEATLAWGIEPALGATLSPEPGETTITIEIAPRPESAALVDMELKRSEDGREDLLIEESGQCRDEIQILADVKVTSENGAFDDSFVVTFRAKSAHVVTGAVEVVPGDLEGSFDVTTEGNGKPRQTTLSMNFSFGTLSGEILGVWEEALSGDGDEVAVSGGWISYGRFPADGCDSGSLISFDSPLGSTIVEAVNSHTEFDFSWQSGDATRLTLTPTVEKLCFEASGSAADSVISGPVSVSLASEDERILADWDLEVRAYLDGEDITSLNVRSLKTQYEGHSPSAFEDATGLVGIESDAEALSFDFTYDIALGDEGASGTLTIFELDIPECADSDYAPEDSEIPGGGSSVPGCEGTTLVELETATFTSVSASSGE